MSTGQIWRTESISAANTCDIAAKIGRKLRGGEVIELVSDLGGGKTTFVNGLAIGMGSKDRVHSPSFTLKNEYQAGELTLHHFDFYRLGEAGIMQQELTELLDDSQAIIVIEWANIIRDILPADHLTVRIETSDIDTRQFVFEYPGSMGYLMKDKS